MASSYRLYSLLRGIWLVAGFGIAIGLLSGWAGFVYPDLPPAAERPPVVAGLVGLTVVGGLVFRRLRNGQLRTVGRQAGLPELAGSGSGLIGGPFALIGMDGLPDFQGTVDGRTVRAKTYSVSQGKNSPSRQYTLVEAELEAPIEGSIALGPVTDEMNHPVALMDDKLPASVERVELDDGVLAIGPGAGRFVEETLTGQTRDVFLAADSPKLLAVGDPTAPFRDELHTSFWNHPWFDESTVTTNNDGVVLDPEELRRQANGTAAIANAVEGADVEAPRR